MSAFQRYLPDEAATLQFGEDIAAALRPGDVIALDGDLGAGKTALARAIIRALANDATLEVPSPTFTLVQTYETRLSVAHFDLYRIGYPGELEELGFSELAADGVRLIEWPGRAGDRLPDGTITIALGEQDAGRQATITGPEPSLARISRSLAMRDFLDSSGWRGAHRAHLTGDASARSYETVSLAGRDTAVLMNAPPLVLGPPVRRGKAYAEIAHTSRDVSAFVAVDRILHHAGLAVPRILAQDLDQGFLVIEHLGSGSFLDAKGEPFADRYAAAAELLAVMHGRNPAHQAEAAPGIVHKVPPFDREAMLIEVDLLIDWYLPAVTGRQATVAEREGFAAVWNAALDRLADVEEGLVLRDYHSPNLIWRGERQGIDRLGVIDFQDALVGPLAYDVASLAMDARVTIPPAIERSTVAAYVAARQAAGAFDVARFDAAYAAMAAQRNSKILGIFVRLDRRDGKPAYLKHLPRIRDYLRRALAHPSLAEMRAFYERHGFLEERAL